MRSLSASHLETRVSVLLIGMVRTKGRARSVMEEDGKFNEEHTGFEIYESFSFCTA